MANEIEEKKLCDALSGLFVIGEIHYDWIARSVSIYKLNYIENVLFDLVGPVLWFEYYTTTPEVWGHDAEWLWSEIKKINARIGADFYPCLKVVGAGLCDGCFVLLL